MQKRTSLFRLSVFLAIPILLSACDFPGGYTTVYPQSCKKIDGVWKPEKSIWISWQVKVFPDAQTVLFKTQSVHAQIGGLGRPTEECTVWDKKNWSCKHGASMKNGVLEPKCGITTGDQPYCEVYPGRIERFMVPSAEVCKFATQAMEAAPKEKDGTIPSWALKHD